MRPGRFYSNIGFIRSADFDRSQRGVRCRRHASRRRRRNGGHPSVQRDAAVERACARHHRGCANRAPTDGGLIVDGIHVDSVSVRTAFASKGCDRIALVTDAMPTVGASLDRFELVGRSIKLVDGRLTTEDGLWPARTWTWLQRYAMQSGWRKFHWRMRCAPHRSHPLHSSAWSTSANLASWCSR